MHRGIPIAVLVLTMGLGCTGRTDRTEPAPQTEAPEATSRIHGQDPSETTPGSAPEETSPIAKDRRKQNVGKGDLSKPLDDRVEEVLPVKIRRNEDGTPKMLHLRGYGVSKADLEEIATYTELDQLQIGWNDLDDEDLTYFSRLEKLRILGIRHNPGITGATFAVLARLPALKDLYMSECSIRPEYLKALSASRSLRILGIRSYEIDQEWIDALCSISTLEEVHVDEPDITPDQIRSLEACLPGVKVETHKPRVQTD